MLHFLLPSGSVSAPSLIALQSPPLQASAKAWAATTEGGHSVYQCRFQQGDHSPEYSGEHAVSAMTRWEDGVLQDKPLRWACASYAIGSSYSALMGLWRRLGILPASLWLGVHAPQFSMEHSR